MVETAYGVRNYTCSNRTRRAQKNQLDSDKIEKRNARQRKLYITLDNIDEIFSANERWPICYDLIFNTIQGKVTKYFNVRNYDRKKEVSYDCINKLYSILKRKLLTMKQNQGLLNPEPVLFFYLSQFFRYLDLIVYSTVFHGTQDQKYQIQEPDAFKTDDVLVESNSEDIYDIKKYIGEVDIEQDNSESIKNCIEQHEDLTNSEKNVLLKIYKGAYSKFGQFSLTKKDNEILESIHKRIADQPDLLKDLEDILNG